MPDKITSIPARDLIKVFEKFGYKLGRQKGSHIMMTKSGSRTLVIQESINVPVPHILANLRSANITRNEYLKALSEI